VFSPLQHFAIQPGQRVGAIGIGGLGHLALQFARAWGCEVTAFSSSPDRESEAREFGASRFTSSFDSKTAVEEGPGHDLIISTAHVLLDWEAYVNMLRPYGKLCFVGATIISIERDWRNPTTGIAAPRTWPGTSPSPGGVRTGTRLDASLGKASGSMSQDSSQGNRHPKAMEFSAHSASAAAGLG
jgi:Zn-dependent alcohol dehydrogenase